MNATVQTEVSFVSALQTHRSADFSLIYNAYAPALYGVLLRLVNDQARAEDLLQDAFVKIWSNSHLYDPKQGRLFTWLLTITRNIAMDELRARKVQAKAASYIYDRSEQVTTASVPEGTVHVSILNHLAPKYRAVVELMYYRDYTSQEAAEQLKIPIGTVKTRVRSALQQLKVHFNQDIHHYLSWSRG